MVFHLILGVMKALSKIQRRQLVRLYLTPSHRLKAMNWLQGKDKLELQLSSETRSMSAYTKCALDCMMSDFRGSKTRNGGISNIPNVRSSTPTLTVVIVYYITAPHKQAKQNWK